MVKFTATILQFGKQGEKTGWSYIEIPNSISGKLKPGYKKSFRVKGNLDQYSIEGIALLPMGGGGFIMALNAEMRKAIKKQKGAKVKVQLEVDDEFEFKLAPEFMECLEEEPAALSFFNSLTKGHQSYYIKWVLSAKTEQTKAKRMAEMITGLIKKQDFGTMLRSLKQNRPNIKRY